MIEIGLVYVCPICVCDFSLQLQVLPGVCVTCVLAYEHFNEMDW